MELIFVSSKVPYRFYSQLSGVIEIRVVEKGSWKEREIGKFKLNLERL